MKQPDYRSQCVSVHYSQLQSVQLVRAQSNWFVWSVVYHRLYVIKQCLRDLAYNLLMLLSRAYTLCGHSVFPSVIQLTTHDFRALCQLDSSNLANWFRARDIDTLTKLDEQSSLVVARSIANISLEISPMQSSLSFMAMIRLDQLCVGELSYGLWFDLVWLNMRKMPSPSCIPPTNFAFCDEFMIEITLSINCAMHAGDFNSGLRTNMKINDKWNLFKFPWTERNVCRFVSSPCRVLLV